MLTHAYLSVEQLNESWVDSALLQVHRVNPEDQQTDSKWRAPCEKLKDATGNFSDNLLAAEQWPDSFYSAFHPCFLQRVWQWMVKSMKSVGKSGVVLTTLPANMGFHACARSRRLL